MRSRSECSPVPSRRACPARRFAWVAVVLSWSLCAARVAAAPTAAERETARALMDEGDELHDAGDLWGALERFHAADAIMHVPTTGLELARIQAQLLQLVEARATALEVASSAATPHEPKAFTAARKSATALAAELAPRVPDVTIKVEPQVADMRVSIDGTTLPRLPRPLPFKLNPGSHMLVVEAPGYETSTQQLSLADSQHATLDVVLKPHVSEAPVPPRAIELAALSAPAADQGADTGAAGRTRGYIALIAGGAVLAGGITSGILSATQTSRIRERCGGYSCSPEQRSDVVGAYTLANVANVTIPLGVLGIAYGLFELFTHPVPTRDARVSAGLEWSLRLEQPGISVRGAL